MEFSANGVLQKRYFCQLAGAGLDARAIELVDWRHKKQIGPLAYVIAGLKALARKETGNHRARERAKRDGRTCAGRQRKVLRRVVREFCRRRICATGGWTSAFCRASTGWTLLRSVPALLLRGKLPARVAQHLSAETFELTSESAAAFELDGEWAGKLPVTFSIEREKLRVMVPSS